ncbi:hypothetical protein AB0L99_12765 [Streptomyces sp. NPDC051954]|uniref:hypothetical protein n=1 Tax=Streptomyces sp. NPDC051954 TaxID=3155524 RepID=UPI0034455933
MNALLSSPTGTTVDALTGVPGETELAPLLTAWDQAHATVPDPEWRHLLDEIVHPATTEAFHRLAEAAA